MKPLVISHMVASIDGRILLSRWRPADALQKGLFERLHEVLGGDAWLVGRVDRQEFAKQEAYPGRVAESFPSPGSLVVTHLPTGSCWTATARSHGDALISATILSSWC